MNSHEHDFAAEAIEQAAVAHQIKYVQEKMAHKVQNEKKAKTATKKNGRNRKRERKARK